MGGERKEEDGKKGGRRVRGEEMKGRWKHQTGALNAGILSPQVCQCVYGGDGMVILYTIPPLP